MELTEDARALLQAICLDLAAANNEEIAEAARPTEESMIETVRATLTAVADRSRKATRQECIDAFRALTNRWTEE